MINNKLCIFCGNRCTGKYYLSKEHIFGRWIQKGFFEYDKQPKGKVRHTENRSTKSDWYQVHIEPGKLSLSGHPLHRQLKGIVCNTCNNGWLSKVQNDAKDAYSAMHKGHPTSLSIENQAALRKWVYLIDIYLRSQLDDAALAVSPKTPKDPSQKFREQQIRSTVQAARAQLVTDAQHLFQKNEVRSGVTIFGFSSDPQYTSLGLQNLVPLGIETSGNVEPMGRWLYFNLIFLSSSIFLVSNCSDIFPQRVVDGLLDLGGIDFTTSSPSEVVIPVGFVRGRTVEQTLFSWVSHMRSGLTDVPVRFSHGYGTIIEAERAKKIVL